VEVAIYVLRSYRAPLAVLVNVLKKMRSLQLPAIVNDFRDSPVIDCDLMFDAALASEPQ
jgi:hypothetical protein